MSCIHRCPSCILALYYHVVFYRTSLKFSSYCYYSRGYYYRVLQIIIYRCSQSVGKSMNRVVKQPDASGECSFWFTHQFDLQV